MAAAIKMDELLVNWLGSDEVYENVLEWIENYNPLQPSSDTTGGGEDLSATPASSSVPHSEHNLGAYNNNASTSNPTSPLMASSSPRSAGSTSSSTGGDTTTTGSPKSAAIPPFFPQKGPRWGKKITVQDSWEPLELPLMASTSTSTTSVYGDNVMHPELGGGSMMEEDLIMQQLPAKETALQVFAEVGAGPLDNTDQQQRLALPVEQFVRITKEVCHFPSFFNVPLFQRIQEIWKSAHPEDNNPSDTSTTNTNANNLLVSYEMLEYFWQHEMEPFDAPDRFFRLIKQRDADCIVRDDFFPFIRALLRDHPGLEFLSSHDEFQSKYAVTVITRIFYAVNRGHSGRISARQVRQSDLLAAFWQVDEEEDINKVTRYFSYEHFYVLYCRFWELDHDRDYRITREDLLKYGDHSLSHMIVDRIFDAAPRPFGASGSSGSNSSNNNNNTAASLSPSSTGSGNNNNNNSANNSRVNNSRDYLTYEDFIYFMLSEEDKSNEVSVRYWFQCVDVDGDGKLNNMELRSFYAVQLHRMQCMGNEIVPFEDMLCQIMDMIKPKNADYFITEDFLQPECAQVSGALFDALFNLNKYLLFEQRDPFAERQKREDEFATDWDRFACIDYNRLAMEEEAREEEAMEIDWVTVDEEEDQQQQRTSGSMESSPSNKDGDSASESPF